MPRPKSPLPTESELQVLRIVWGMGVFTVRNAYEALRQQRDIAMTTVATTVAGMVEKELLRVVDDRRPHRMVAAVDEAFVQGEMIRLLADRAFDGSTRELVAAALTTMAVTSDERAALELLLKNAERGR